MSRLARWVGLPAVTAYLVTGLLLGPYCLGGLGLAGIGFHTMADVSAMAIIPDAALGFIAFTIGNEFRLDDLRHMGRQAVTIGILQAVATTVFVDAALVGLHFLVPGSISIPSAITLGAIAAATAPAATLMVVRQYRADGAMVRSVVLFSVLVYELVGPTLTKNALFAAGEIHPDELKPDDTPVPAQG